MADKLLALEEVSVQKQGATIFEGLHFAVRKGEHWALTGRSGAGKTVLLETLAGKCRITQGRFRKNFDHDHSADVIYLPVQYAFRNRAGMQDFFYQQRFNAAFSDDVATVTEYLSEQAKKQDNNGYWTYDKVIQLFKLDTLLNENLIKLSNGETKRLRLASALIRNPQLLLLDNPLVGLDVNTRRHFGETLDQIAASGITIILSTSLNEIPKTITHVAILEDCKMKASFPKEQLHHYQNSQMQTTVIDSQQLLPLLKSYSSKPFEIAVKMNEVTIRYDGRVILDRVSWEVKAGERWALKGPNGAGKSTLLSLINADNPQAYANDIILFDRKRGSGESIWDIKQRIGFVSPELRHYFRTNMTCATVIASGLSDGKRLQQQVPSIPPEVSQWLRLFQLESLSNQLFKTASPAQQVIVLLARALIKNPDLLILDEPCQELDSAQANTVRDLVDTICAQTPTTLIYVSHYEDQLPHCIQQVIELKNGKRVL